MIKLFGFTLGKKDTVQVQAEEQPAIVLPQAAIEDGAVTITQGAYYGTYVDLEGSVRNELELVSRYREMSLHPECAMAIDDIVTEAISQDADNQIVRINLEQVEQPESIKKKIEDEFNEILHLFNFKNISEELFRRWYVDGRLYFHVMVDEDNPKQGIQELRFIDPRKIRKVREVLKQRDPKTGVEKIGKVSEYYVFNDRGMTAQSYTASVNQGVRIATDSIVYVPSGMLDAKSIMVISHLHKAIKPLNQLRMIEDAVVIYRLSRAPERRIFYIDVGNLPKLKAEQYVHDIMVKYRNKLVYDACLSMDTKIPLLDGRTLPLSEIQTEFESGKQLWVYSCDPHTGKFAPGLVTSAGVTKFQQPVMRLTLDNGKTITCTHDHKFPVWGKGKVEAKDLVVGDSMIPHYTRQHTMAPKIHIAAIDYLDELMDVGTLGIDKHEIYHDYHTFALDVGIYTCNSTGEIRDERKHLCLTMDTKVPLLDGRTLTLDQISQEYTQKPLWAYSCDPTTGKFAPGLITWAGVSRPNAEVMRLTLDNGKTIDCTPDHKFPVWNVGLTAAKDLQLGDSLIPLYRRLHEITPGAKQEKHYEQIWENDLKEWTFTHKAVSSWKDDVGLPNQFVFNEQYAESPKETEELQYTNHKVVKIEYLENRVDAGCLTIDGDERYHNYHTFALDAGVYTQNSMLEDFWLPRREGCLSLDTKIKLLDGRDVELGQLIVEYQSGKTNWTYSVSPEGTIVPGKISWAGVTRTDAEVLDIHLDNGEVITATPDHKFILRNGVQVEAQSLQEGASLMPLYMREAHITHNQNGLYPQIQDNKSGTWKFVHRMVAESIFGERQSNEVVHHKDFTRINNTPENLVYMDKQDHFLYHSQCGTKSWENGDRQTHIQHLSESGKAFFSTKEGQKRKREISAFNMTCKHVWRGLQSGREKIKQLRAADKLIMSQEEYLKKWSPGLNSTMASLGSEAAKNKILADRANMTPEAFREKYAQRNKTGYMNKTSTVDLSQIECAIRTLLEQNINASNSEIVDVVACIYPSFNLKKLRIFLEHQGYESISDFIARRIGMTFISKKRAVQVQETPNHQVVKIVRRTDRLDVGTLTIDEHHEHHDYHNFALSSGIFVMNSKGTEITTLPPGQNLGQLEDVIYFRKKLYQSLNVPITRLDDQTGGGLGGLGRAAEITRDEVKFFKFIQRLRRKFSQIFDDTLRVQLSLKGICSVDEWDQLKKDVTYDYMSDNHYYELRDAELTQNRVALATQIEPFVGTYYSQQWVKRHILRMTEDEIEKMDTELEHERKEAPPLETEPPTDTQPAAASPKPVSPKPQEKSNI